MDATIRIYDYSLAPVAPFSWFGLGISTLDILGALRLCIALRQIREVLHKQHVGPTPESRSFARSGATTLVVVFGGEIMTCPLLGVPPSFMVSGTSTVFFLTIQALVDMAPSIPAPFLEMELLLSILDGFTRAILLCNIIPPAVTMNASSQIATSAWALLLTSFLAANGGFFLVNMFSFMHPTGLAMQTPPELLPYGWMTADLWCAPLVTGLYALLTHAQPFWAHAHTVVTGVQLGDKATEPVDSAKARAVCAILLAALFSVRTVKNFRQVLSKSTQAKLKTQ